MWSVKTTGQICSIKLGTSTEWPLASNLNLQILFPHRWTTHCPCSKRIHIHKGLTTTLYMELTGIHNHLQSAHVPINPSPCRNFPKIRPLPISMPLAESLKYVISTKYFTIKYGGNGSKQTVSTRCFESTAMPTRTGDPTLSIQSPLRPNYIFMMNGGPISWKSGKQITVALSTTESELMALSDAARETLAHFIFF